MVIAAMEPAAMGHTMGMKLAQCPASSSMSAPGYLGKTAAVAAPQQQQLSTQQYLQLLHQSSLEQGRRRVKVGEPSSLQEQQQS
jgi:hypothetical protein